MRSDTTFTYECCDLSAGHEHALCTIDAVQTVDEHMWRGKLQRHVSWKFRNVTLGIDLKRLNGSEYTDAATKKQLYVSDDPRQPPRDPGMAPFKSATS